MFPEENDRQSSLFDEESVYSVSEITYLIKSVLDEEFPNLWVEGEVSNLKEPKSGHIYFTLKDDKAQLKAVMFNSSRKKVKFKIEDGMKVLCFGRISVYPQGGSYQLYVEQMHAKGVGDLQLAFMQLKEKLEKEGLFLDDHKKELPFMPSLIGVITSGTGAAVRDIIKVARRRFPEVGILIYPVKVQGDGAAEEIAEAINEMNRLFKNEVDLLIVGRGGGSIEDLWAFNEEIVARAIFDSEIPVISAVGHEIDWTISDFVADKRAPTPSAAAEIAVPDKDKLIRHIDGLSARLKNNALLSVQAYRNRLKLIATSRAFMEPKYIIQQQMQRLDELIRRLGDNLKQRQEKTQLHLKHLGVKLEILSPLSILNRGYGIVYDKNKKVVVSVKQVKPDDNLDVRLKDGSVPVIVLRRSGANQQRRKDAKAGQRTLF